MNSSLKLTAVATATAVVAIAIVASILSQWISSQRIRSSNLKHYDCYKSQIVVNHPAGRLKMKNHWYCKANANLPCYYSQESMAFSIETAKSTCHRFCCFGLSQMEMIHGCFSIFF